jgi:hypothetical protein
MPPTFFLSRLAVFAIPHLPQPQLSWSHDCCHGVVQKAEMAAKTSTFLISAIKVTVASLVTVIEWLHVHAFFLKKLLFLSLTVRDR